MNEGGWKHLDVVRKGFVVWAERKFKKAGVLILPMWTDVVPTPGGLISVF